MFYKLTNDVRVTVRPWFLAAQSQPTLGRFVFGYHIRIEYVGPKPVQLLTRYWLIKDSNGEETIVEGEGVVGEQPVLAPFRSHEYQSYCVLKSPSGSMEGRYRFVRDDGSRFEAEIPRFELDAGATAES
jgi:ApaG protein